MQRPRYLPYLAPCTALFFIFSHLPPPLNFECKSNFCHILSRDIGESCVMSLNPYIRKSFLERITVLLHCQLCWLAVEPLFACYRPSPSHPFLHPPLFSTAPLLGSCIHSLTSPFSALPSVVHRWTIKLGDFGAGGCGLIWPQSDGTICTSETFFVVTTLALIALTLLLLLVLSIEEGVHMSLTKPNKTVETPTDELPFPGKLVEGKYDVQYLHLWVNFACLWLLQLAPNPFLFLSKQAKQENPHCMVQGILASHLQHCPSIDSSPDWFQHRQGKWEDQWATSFPLFSFHSLTLLFFSALPQAHIVSTMIHGQVGKKLLTSSCTNIARSYSTLLLPTMMQCHMRFPQRPQEIKKQKRK